MLSTSFIYLSKNYTSSNIELPCMLLPSGLINAVILVARRQSQFLTSITATLLNNFSEKEITVTAAYSKFFTVHWYSRAYF